jgi:hypothetical protein
MSGNVTLAATLAPKLNLFNQRIPDTNRFKYEWYSYGVLLVILTVYSLFLAYHIYKTIHESQNGAVGKIRAITVGIVVLFLLIGVGLLLRWFVIITGNPVLIITVISIDLVTCLLELLYLCLKSALSTTSSVFNLVFLIFMDVIEIIILALMLQEIKSWCHGLDSKDGTVCYSFLEKF